MVTRLSVVPLLLGAVYIIHAAATDPCVSGFPPVVENVDYRPLVEWFETRTQARLIPPPFIMVVPSSTFKALVKKESEYGAEIMGAEQGHKILLDERISDMRSPTNAALLIHELKHYKQEITGQKFGCDDQREADAFAMQNVFLLEHHFFPVMPNEEIKRLQSCS